MARSNEQIERWGERPLTPIVEVTMASRRHFAFPRSEGKSSRQAHCDLPEGTYERELGKEGFFGPATMMYHRHPPTGWERWEGPLRPHAFDLTQLACAQDSLWSVPDILFNAHCRLRQWHIDLSMTRLLRNGDGDDLLFIHRGQGSLFCDYGHLPISKGDYVLIPRSTSWRIEISEPITLLAIEATNGSYQLPEKGMVGRHAIFDDAVLETPHIDEAFIAQQDDQAWVIDVRRHGAISRVHYPFNPLDAVGWHGDLSPVRLNMKDIRPLSSHRYHLPPSAHTTFVAPRFVICSFVPRPFETAADAIKVPFFHNNDDFDEVLFYHDGDFFSRDNIHPGMLTWHPCGFTHGPHPKALQRMYEQPETCTTEYAVMLDCRDGLTCSEAASSVEWMAYADSWKSALASENK